jgi:acyl carrier protein
MAGSLTGAAARRIRASWPPPLTLEQGMALFDAAVDAGAPHLVPLGPAMTALAAGGRTAGPVPPLFRALAGRGRRAAAGPGQGGGLARELAGMPAGQRVRHVTGVVLGHAAVVLGHASASAVDPGGEFRGLGFDSLTAVELRNRLAAATGLRLSATLVFDYPTPAALAEYLARELDPGTAGRETEPTSLLAELDRLEVILAATAPDDVAKSGVALRLQRLMDKWRLAGASSGTTDVIDRIERASTNEIFDFIDHQLGRLSDR